MFSLVTLSSQLAQAHGVAGLQVADDLFLERGQHGEDVGAVHGALGLDGVGNLVEAHTLLVLYGCIVSDPAVLRILALHGFVLNHSISFNG